MSQITLTDYLPAAIIVLQALVLLLLIRAYRRTRLTCRQLNMQVEEFQNLLKQSSHELDQHKEQIMKMAAKEQHIREMEDSLCQEQVIEENETLINGMKLTDTMLMSRIEQLTTRNISNMEFTADKMAQVFCLSRTQLDRRMKRIAGKSAITYIQDRRMERARELLLTTERSIANIALACGYDDTSYFSRVFKHYYDCTPTQARREES